MYLVPARDGGKYLDSLRALIGDETRIRLHPPVRPAELADTLNGYDVGIFSLPPLTPNHRLMLPNKIFDYVQARLGIVFNASLETDRIILDHELGAIAPDPTEGALHDTLAALTEDQVSGFKQNADKAAKVLNSVEDAAVTRTLAAELLGQRA
jgi:hypothetical protein